jgi:aminotransferase
VEALQQAETDIEEMRAAYRKRRNFMYQSFRDMGLDCSLPEGAFYAFPHIGVCGLGSKEFALKFLEVEKVAVVPGTAFGPSGEGFVRCAYATSLEDIKEAMSRMARFVRRAAVQPA